MPNSVAEAYLLILRPSFVPVVGEAVPIPFNEQIEIDGWDWTLENEERVEQQAARDKADQAAVSTVLDKDDKDKKQRNFGSTQALSLQNEVAELMKKLNNLDQNDSRGRRDLNKKIRDRIDADVGKVIRDDQADLAEKKKTGKYEGNEKLRFTFKKNVDAATTQLLNSFKNGDVMPKAVLTLFHRSVNAPVTLVITFGKVRLKKYDLSINPTDTMSDLTESWECTFESVDYAYQNRPAATGPNGLTKGTVRVFKMK